MVMGPDGMMPTVQPQPLMMPAFQPQPLISEEFQPQPLMMQEFQPQIIVGQNDQLIAAPAAGGDILLNNQEEPTADDGPMKNDDNLNVVQASSEDGIIITPGQDPNFDYNTTDQKNNNQYQEQNG